MNKPLCSIIIPSYNHSKFLARSIECSLKQTYKFVEVIVVDDGSTDETSEIVKKYSNKILYHRKINGGLGAARNTGIKLSRGEYLQFLDADDFIDETKIEKQIPFFENDPGLSIVYSACGCTEATGTSIDNISYELKDGEDPVKILFGRSLFPVHAGLIKKSAILDAGCFDEARVAQEDWQLWLKIALNKGRFKYISENLAHYDQVGSAMISNPVLMFKRTHHMLSSFMSDPDFVAQDKHIVSEFKARQSLLLAVRAFNNAWWKLARKYYWMALYTSPKNFGIRNLFRILRTFYYQAKDLVVSKKRQKPEDIGN